MISEADIGAGVGAPTAKGPCKKCGRLMVVYNNVPLPGTCAQCKGQEFADRPPAKTTPVQKPVKPARNSPELRNQNYHTDHATAGRLAKKYSSRVLRAAAALAASLEES